MRKQAALTKLPEMQKDFRALRKEFAEALQRLDALENAANQ